MHSTFDYMEKLRDILKYRKNEQLSYSDNLVRKSHYRILLISYLAIIILILFAFTLRTTFGEPIENHYSLIVVGTLFAIILYRLVKNQTVRLATYTLCLILVIFIPVRYFQLDTITAPALIVYLLVTVIAFGLFEKRMNAILLVAFNSAMLILMIINSFIAGESAIHLFVGASILILNVLTAVIMSVIIATNNKAFKELKTYEINQSSELIMMRLTHEIFNALNAAYFYLEELNTQTRNDDELIKLNDQLTHIHAIIQKMAELHENEELIEKLKEHQAETSFLDKV